MHIYDEEGERRDDVGVFFYEGPWVYLIAKI
jgi:hypothetical protein